MDIILFIFGTAILLFSGDMLVRAAVDVSLKLAISPTIIGLTVIAFGTSAPELLVGVQATWNGFEGLALGNIVGSNIANILLILGVPALIIPVKSSDEGLVLNYYYMLLATFLFIVFLIIGSINFWHGLFLLLFLLLFILQAVFNSEKLTENLNTSELGQDRKEMNFSILLTFFTIGFVGLPLGANLLISSATNFAKSVGVSEEIIGLTVVAIGTSLPELATSTAAAYRKQINLLLGNVIGSNMFNILGIAGAAALIAPLNFINNVGMVSLNMLAISSIILAPFIIFRKSINRLIGGVFLLLYIIYIIGLF